MAFENISFLLALIRNRFLLRRRPHEIVWPSVCPTQRHDREIAAIIDERLSPRGPSHPDGGRALFNMDARMTLCLSTNNK
jgi:hypothetical protein